MTIPDDQRAHWAKVQVVLSMTDHGIVVGWDTCFRCSRRVNICPCKEGPLEPKYVTDWRPSVKQEAAVAEPVETPMVREVDEVGSVFNATEQEKEDVADALVELHDAPQSSDLPQVKMRKPRSDKGKPRGPRIKPTEEQKAAVKQAAENLGSAMKENDSA